MRHLSRILVCAWVLWQMGTTREGQWFKPLADASHGVIQLQALEAETCRAIVKDRADRWVIGLLGWYPDEKYDKTKWIGCLPADYDPYERR